MEGRRGSYALSLSAVQGSEARPDGMLQGQRPSGSQVHDTRAQVHERNDAIINGIIERGGAQKGVIHGLTQWQTKWLARWGLIRRLQATFLRVTLAGVP